jgi:hypothetical protein
MKIDSIIEELLAIRKRFGNIEVTCTGSTLPDVDPRKMCGIPTVYETTADNLIVNENHPIHGKAVRIWQ